MRRGSKIGEREERHARVEFEALCKVCGKACNLRQIFRAWVNVDRCIREEIHAVFNDHDINARGARGTRSGVMYLQSWANDIRIVIGQSANTSIRITHLNHQRSKHIWITHFLSSFEHRQALTTA